MRKTDLHLGHAGNRDLAVLEELQRKAALATITDEELLRLALLQIEPAHDAFAAVDTLKYVLARGPWHDIARVWLGYLFVYELMDEDALRDAIRIADEVSANERRLKSAALWIKGSALRQLQIVDRGIAVLEESVKLEPEWVANRLALANAYRDADRKGDAIEQLTVALAKVGNAKAIECDDLFETLITGSAPSSQMIVTINEEIRRLGG